MLGVHRHCRFAQEATWGTYPGSPTLVHIPVIGDGYTVAQSNEHYEPRTSMYKWHMGPRRVFKKAIAGDITMPIQGEYLEEVLGWIFTRDATSFDGESFACEKRDGVEGTRHTGLKVDTATIEGDAESGNFTIRLGVIGKSEGTISSFAIPAVTDTITSGYIADAFWAFQDGNSLEIPQATARTTMTAFSITVANNLKPGPPGSDQELIWLESSNMLITGSVSLRYDDNTFTTLRRSGGATSFEINATYGGVTLALLLPNIDVVDVGVPGEPDDVVVQTVNFIGEWDSGEDASATFTVT